MFQVYKRSPLWKSLVEKEMVRFYVMVKHRWWWPLHFLLCCQTGSQSPVESRVQLYGERHWLTALLLKTKDGSELLLLNAHRMSFMGSGCCFIYFVTTVIRRKLGLAGFQSDSATGNKGANWFSHQSKFLHVSWTNLQGLLQRHLQVVAVTCFYIPFFPYPVPQEIWNVMKQNERNSKCNLWIKVNTEWSGKP